MKRKYVDFHPVASTSKISTPPRRLKPTPSTPAKRARTFSSIATSIRRRLRKLDSGRCLITLVKKSSATLQAAHIVARKTKVAKVASLETMWKHAPLNLDSTRNLVTLRLDWHLSYDAGDWALVPSRKILKAMLKDGNLTYAMPYKDFSLKESRDYIFVPLPTLGRKNIVREILKDKDDEDDHREDDDEDEDDLDVEVGAKGKGKAKAKAQEEGTMDIFGTAVAYRKPFLNFPNLQHHAHPFFVIQNALPKLQAYREELRPEHMALLTLMEKIQVIWSSRLPNQPEADDDDDEDDDNDNDGDGDDDNTLGPFTRSMARIGRGRGRAKGHGKTSPALPASQASYVDTSSCHEALYEKISEVTAWTEAVSVAGSTKLMDDTVTWSDEEPVRPPIHKWDEWRLQYRQPQEYSEFCSSDWPMYLYSYALWLPSLGAR